VVTSDASATGGPGPAGAGVATATAIGNGASGSADAHANTMLASTAQVTAITTDASASVIGSTTVKAESLLGGTSPGFITTPQAVAFGTGSPVAASINPILAINPGISAAFGTNPTILAMEELGGGYSVGGTGSEGSTSVVDFNATLVAQDLAKDLTVGLFSGRSVGGGVTGVTLDITGNNVDLLNQSFANGAAATAYFTNHAVDLGALSATQYSGGTLDLHVSLQVTTNAPHSGFYGGILISG
jgi:hypothetical protein